MWGTFQSASYLHFSVLVRPQYTSQPGAWLPEGILGCSLQNLGPGPEAGSTLKAKLCTQKSCCPRATISLPLVGLICCGYCDLVKKGVQRGHEEGR
jgi:hypothetical protein